MEGFAHAQALYREVADHPESSVDAFRARLSARAQEVRLGIVSSIRSGASAALERAEPEEREGTADVLQEAAENLHQAFRGASPTLRKLPDDTAGEAQLGADVIRIDPQKLSGEHTIVDRERAEDILAHEQEHTEQSAEADADAIEIHGQRFDAREIREAAAISVQRSVAFLSDEYRSIAARLTMDAEDRRLVREGRFQALEAKKSGYRLAA
jgi:hypothetical protein